MPNCKSIEETDVVANVVSVSKDGTSFGASLHVQSDKADHLQKSHDIRFSQILTRRYFQGILDQACNMHLHLSLCNGCMGNLRLAFA